MIPIIKISNYIMMTNITVMLFFICDSHGRVKEVAFVIKSDNKNMFARLNIDDTINLISPSIA